MKMTKPKADNRFKKWLMSKDVKDMAKLIGTSRRAIIRWRSGYPPDLEHALTILIKSKGAVTARDLQEHSRRSK